MNPDPIDCDIFSHSCEGFSLATAQALAGDVVDRFYRPLLEVLGEDVERAGLLMTRPCIQYLFVDHLRHGHQVTLARAADGARISRDVAARLREAAQGDCPISAEHDLPWPQRALVNLLWKRVQVRRAVRDAERHLNSILPELVADLDEAPDRILEALSQTAYRKKTYGAYLTAGELAFLASRTTLCDPQSLGPASWFAKGLKAVIQDGGAMGHDLTYLPAFHKRSGRTVKVPVLVGCLGYPAREIICRIGTEQASPLVWLYQALIQRHDGAPAVCLRDNAAGNDSESLLLAMAIQGSIPVSCRHPAENTTEDAHRRLKDLQPSVLDSAALPAWLFESSAFLPRRYASKVRLVRLTDLKREMARFVDFRTVRLRRGDTVDYDGIVVHLEQQPEHGSAVIAGIRPHDFWAVGLQPCDVVVFACTLDPLGAAP